MSDSAKKIIELNKLPQKLCKMCGKCCTMVPFRGGLSYKEMLTLIENPETEPSLLEGAKDFLTIFEPVYSHDDVKKIAPDFLEEVISKTENKNVSFFKCKYVGKNGGCLIHEDRPTGCRVYPFPHEKTFFFNDCGFKEQSLANLKQINTLIKEVEEKKKENWENLQQVNAQLKEIQELKRQLQERIDAANAEINKPES